MIDGWIKTITQLQAVKSVSELPRWLIAAGVVGSLAYVVIRQAREEQDGTIEGEYSMAPDWDPYGNR